MKTTDELTQEYENSYPKPTKGTKVMAGIMCLVILSGVIMFIGGIYYILYLILNMI
jgi:hypothetical protein